MIDITRAPLSVSFKKPLRYQEPYRKPDANPEKASKWIMERGMDCRSVIVLYDPIDDGLKRDGKHYAITNNFGPSFLEGLAKEEAADSPLSDADIKKIVKQKGYPSVRSTASNVKPVDNREYRKKLEARVRRAHELMQLPRVIFEFKKQFDSEYSSLPKNEMQAKWREELFDMLLPTVVVSEKRTYDMPSPFSVCADGSPWQQFYFTEKMDVIDVVVGSKTAFEDHRKYGGIFGYMAGKHHYEVPTYVFRYTSKNEFKLVREYECFKLMRDSFGPVRAQHFKNRLVNLVRSEFLEVYE